MNNLTKILVGVMILTLSVSAEVALDITDIGVSAEAIALGGVHSSSQTAHAIFINPSLLDHRVNWSVDMFQTQTIEDVKIQNFSISKAYKMYSFGLGYTRTGMSDIPKTKEDETKNNVIIQNGSYAYNYDTFYAGSSMVINNSMIVGGSLKVVKTELDDISGQGINADLGVQYIKPSYQLGLGIHNALPILNMSYSGSDQYEDEDLPLKVFINGSKKINFKNIKSTVHLQFSKHDSYPIFYAGGATIAYKDFPYIEGLVGMRTMAHLDDKIMRKSVGINLNIKDIKFSYAYEHSDMVLYNNMHYFSLSLFNKSKNKQQTKK